MPGVSLRAVMFEPNPSPFEFDGPAPQATRVYGASRGNWLFYGGLAGCSIAGGLASFAYMALDGAFLPGVFMLALFGGCGALLFWSLYVTRLELHSDAVVVRELGRGTRRVARSEITGRRRGQHGELLLEVQAGKRLVMSLVPTLDDALTRWLESVPDLDLADYVRSREEVLASPLLGPTVEVRAEELRRAQLAATVLTGVSVCAGVYLLWPAHGPAPVVELLVALIPAIALVLLVTGRGLYDLVGERRDARANLLIPLLVGGLLEWRVFLDANYVERSALLAIGACIGVVLAAVATRLAPGRRPRGLRGGSR